MSSHPGSKLSERCVSPEALIHATNYRIDAEYYITRNIIPPLERLLGTVGINVKQWFDDMPRPTSVSSEVYSTRLGIQSYMKSDSCLVCDTEMAILADSEKKDNRDMICVYCRNDSTYVLQSRLNLYKKRQKALEDVCRSCSGFEHIFPSECVSQDCPIFYQRMRNKLQVASNQHGLSSDAKD